MRAQTAIVVGGGVLAVAVLVYVWQRGLGNVARGAARAAGDIVGGGVVGLGEAIGIPATNMNECQRALAEGRYWDASFVCPAGTLIKGFFGDSPQPIPESVNAPASSTGTATPSSSSPAPDFSYEGWGVR